MRTWVGIWKLDTIACLLTAYEELSLLTLGGIKPLTKNWENGWKKKIVAW